MSLSDLESLEKIEYDAYIDLYRAAPEDVRAAHDIKAVSIGAATCLTCQGVEPALVFRRAVGVGFAKPVSEEELDQVISYMGKHAGSYAVPLAPQSKPATLAAWLERRGLTLGYAWMKFRRSCGVEAQSDCELDIRVIGSDLGGEFGRIVASAFGLPASVVPWVKALPGRPHWVCLMAFSGRTPVATGALFVNGDYAWLGFGATLESHRRHGAQTALLARRISEAHALGARIAVTETGKRLPGKPNNSYRNILRAGFEEAYLRQNYVAAPPG